MRAVREGRQDNAVKWIEAGADLDAPHQEIRPVATRISTSALVRAIEMQHAPMVRLLLDHGASPNPISGKGTTNGPMTQWLVSLSKTPTPTKAQEEIGLALLHAGGDLRKGLVPEGSAILHDVLKETGKMAWVDRLELLHLADDMARSLDIATTPSRGMVRRPGL